MKDVKGYQEYFDQTLLPALAKWGQDNITDKSELDTYYDALDQYRFDDVGKGTRQKDGILGNYSADKAPLRWKFVTPEEKKELDRLGVSQVSDLYGEDGKLKKEFEFLSKESQDRLNKTRNYAGIDMYIDVIPTPEEPDKPTEQTPFKDYKKPLPKPYTQPMMPDMSEQTPNPMDMPLKQQSRYTLIDPVKMSPENALVEMNRANDAQVAQLDGLTDTQRAAALTNLTANTQANAANTISQVAAQNASIQQQVDQYNNGIMNREEDNRLAEDMSYDQRMKKTVAAYQQDESDYLDKMRQIRINRFNYLKKDRDINAMAENFGIDNQNNIVFMEQTATPLQLLMAGKITEDEYAIRKKAEEARKRAAVTSSTSTLKTDGTGNTTSTSSTTVRSGK